MSLASILAAAVPLVWLMPNHYLPWPSAWQDGIALALIFAAAAACRQRTSLPLLWVLAISVAAAGVAVQWAFGRILFGGDALLVGFYLGAFMLSIALGSSLIRPGDEHGPSGLDAVASVTVLAAVTSVGVALLQWTGNHALGIWVADLPPGARPFANVAQPNHLSTLAFLGLCALLLLRETRRIGAGAFWLGAGYLIAGMVLSGSRTGWVQVGLLLVLALTFQHRTAALTRASAVAGLALVYVAGTLAWPALNNALLLSGGRSVMQQIEGGARVPLWIALIDAIGREPWWGYGWQQVATAQLTVALDHAPIQRHFEHSHNIVIDLLIWAGVPLGATILALGGGAIALQARALRDPCALWLFAAAMGVVVHGLLELPLEYAYFLLPMGLSLGAANALSKAAPTFTMGVWPLRLSSVIGMALLAVVAMEYLEAEQNHRLLRLESARIGTAAVESRAPDLRLLTQLKALLEFARTQARPGMSAAEIDEMRAVALRYPFPPVLLRFALAAGLNGHAAESQLTLRRLCSIHPSARCAEARESWSALRDRYPVLLNVPTP